MSHLVLSVLWNYERVGFNASEGIDLLGDQEQKLPSSVPLYRLHIEVITWIGGGVFTAQKMWIKDLSSSSKI